MAPRRLPALLLVAVLAAAALVAGVRAQCLIFAGGLYFDLALANEGDDANVVLGTTGYTAVLNSCRSIRATDTGICQPGTLACQKTSATLTPFKCLARNITTSTFTGSTLTITYDNGDFCPSQSANRRVLINYTCGTVSDSLPTFVSESPVCTFNFNWATPAGCGSPFTPAPTTPAPVIPATLVVGGEFATAGSTTANQIAQWDVTTAAWSTLASGVSGTVHAVTNYNGAVVAAGDFATASGVPADNVAAWNGAAWAPLGAGVDGTAYALAVWSGSLIVGGTFGAAGGGSANSSNIARWDGASWSSLGAGVSATLRASVAALAVFNGTLAVGGAFSTAGDVSARNVAVWDGASWSALGNGLNDDVAALIEFDGSLVAGGYFSTLGGSYIAQWDGAEWAVMGDGFVGGEVLSLVIYDDDLYASGYFDSSNGIATRGIGRWNPQTLSWAGVGGGLGTPSNRIYALAVAGRYLYAGGDFELTGSGSASRVAQWNGGVWSSLGTGVEDTVFALIEKEQPGPSRCSLSAIEWRTQYETRDGVLVQDLLAFDAPTGAFTKTTTAIDTAIDAGRTAACTLNRVDTHGGYHHQAGGAFAAMTSTRCTQSAAAAGCLRCAPTDSKEFIGVTFGAGCTSVTLTHTDGDVRTYLPVKMSA